MAGPLPTIDVFDEGTRLGALRGTLEDPRWMLEQIGALLVEESQRAFREQKMGDVPWKSRAETGMVPNWPAIIADFASGASSPPSRRFDAVPALIDKGGAGGLAGSFSWRIINQDTVEAGTMKPYAGALHAGEESETEVITEGVQDALWAWIQTTRAERDNATSAPRRREDREVRAAVDDDPEIANIKSALKASKATFSSGKVPKHERERRQRLEARLKERKRQVASEAADKSEGITDREASRLGKARRVNSMAEKLTWLLNKGYTGKRLPVLHPARPMVGVPKTLAERIERLVGVRVKRVG